MQPLHPRIRILSPRVWRELMNRCRVWPCIRHGHGLRRSVISSCTQPCIRTRFLNTARGHRPRRHRSPRGITAIKGGKVHAYIRWLNRVTRPLTLWLRRAAGASVLLGSAGTPCTKMVGRPAHTAFQRLPVTTTRILLPAEPFTRTITPFSLSLKSRQTVGEESQCSSSCCACPCLCPFAARFGAET